jgi:hypothetical protein
MNCSAPGRGWHWGSLACWWDSLRSTEDAGRSSVSVDVSTVLKYIYIQFFFGKSRSYNFLFPKTYIHVSVREFFSQNRSAYLAAAKYVDRFWEYINRSQTHECRNWDWGRTAIPFLGKRKWDFCCSVIFPDFKPMSVSEEPVWIHLFRQNPFEISRSCRTASDLK